MMMEVMDDLLAEIKALYNEVDVNCKADLMISLNSIRESILSRNNLIEMKIAYAKENGSSNFRCDFVQDSDANKWLMLPIEYPPIIKVREYKVYLKSSTTALAELDYFSFVSGQTEDLAWLEYYNKRFAK